MRGGGGDTRRDSREDAGAVAWSVAELHTADYFGSSPGEWSREAWHGWCAGRTRARR